MDFRINSINGLGYFYREPLKEAESLSLRDRLARNAFITFGVGAFALSLQIVGPLSLVAKTINYLAVRSKLGKLKEDTVLSAEARQINSLAYQIQLHTIAAEIKWIFVRTIPIIGQLELITQFFRPEASLKPVIRDLVKEYNEILIKSPELIAHSLDIWDSEAKQTPPIDLRRAEVYYPLESQLTTIYPTAHEYLESISLPSLPPYRSTYSPLTWIRRTVNLIRIHGLRLEDWDKQETARLHQVASTIIEEVERNLHMHYLKDVYTNVDQVNKDLAGIKYKRGVHVNQELNDKLFAIGNSLLVASLSPDWKICIKNNIIDRNIALKFGSKLEEMRLSLEQQYQHEVLSFLELCAMHQGQYYEERIQSMQETILKSATYQSANNDLYSQSTVTSVYEKYLKGFDFEKKTAENGYFQLGLHYLSQNHLALARDAFEKAIKKTGFSHIQAIEKLQKPGNIDDESFNEWFIDLKKTCGAQIKAQKEKKDEILTGLAKFFEFLHSNIRSDFNAEIEIDPTQRKTTKVYF